MDTSLFDGWDKKDQLVLDRGIIKTERGSGRTSVKGVYAGGDAACRYGSGRGRSF